MPPLCLRTLNTLLIVFVSFSSAQLQCPFEVHTVIYTTVQDDVEPVTNVQQPPQPSQPSPLPPSPASPLPIDNVPVPSPIEEEQPVEPAPDAPGIVETITRRFLQQAPTPAPATTTEPVTPAPVPTQETGPAIIDSTDPPTNVTEPTEFPAPVPAKTPEPVTEAPLQMQENTLLCDEEFYSQWSANNITCGDIDLDVEQAVAAASCDIYSGRMTETATGNVATCLQVCRMPACTNGQWNYSSVDGISTYGTFDLMGLLGKDVKDYVKKRTNQAAVQTLKSLNFETDENCAVDTGLSVAENLGECQCPASVGSGVQPDKYKQTSTLDSTGASIAGSAGGSAATVTITTSAVIAVTSTLGTSTGVSTAVTVTTSATGASIAIVTIDFCQFAVMTGQLLDDPDNEDTAVLANFTLSLAPSTFAFFRFLGEYDENDQANQDQRRRRLAQDSSKKTETSGIANYARGARIRPEMLFYVTLAGIGAICILIFLLYFISLGVIGLIGRSVNKYAVRWWDRVIGAFVLLGILTQYVIGVTATFQICWSIDHEEISLALFIAIGCLIFLALGIIFYGILVIMKNSAELRDVGTYDHTKKPINKRYGALYDEYRFEDRYFFAPKMTLALLSGVTTGLVLLSPTYQVGILLVLHVSFLFFLEMRSPYHTKFLQNTASLVTVMKISALVLTFFLISSLTVLKDLQHIVSYVIIAIQLGVLLCLMIRQLYVVLKRYRESKDEKKRLSNETDQTLRNSQGSQGVWDEESIQSAESEMYATNTSHFEELRSTKQSSVYDSESQYPMSEVSFYSEGESTRYTDNDSTVFTDLSSGESDISGMSESDFDARSYNSVSDISGYMRSSQGSMSSYGSRKSRGVIAL